MDGHRKLYNLLTKEGDENIKNSPRKNEKVEIASSRMVDSSNGKKAIQK